MYVCLYPTADLCLAIHAQAIELPACWPGFQGACLVSQGISRRGHTGEHSCVPVNQLAVRRKMPLVPGCCPALRTI